MRDKGKNMEVKEKMEKVKNNKALKLIGNILYTIVFILVLLVLIVAILQRASNNTLSLKGYRIFSVATGSMVPKYNVSDVLLSKEIDVKDIQVGDDVVYIGKEGSFKNRVVTHQVISKTEQDGKYKFITKGIANTEDDPEIDSDQILGKIQYKFKILSLIGKTISNVYIFYFMIFVPIAIIIVKQIIVVINSGKDNEDDSEDEENDDDNSDDLKTDDEEDDSEDEKSDDKENESGDE